MVCNANSKTSGSGLTRTFILIFFQENSLLAENKHFKPFSADEMPKSVG
jgi:hypothetical protein